MVAGGRARAQERLIDREPFDRVVLDRANDNRKLDILPGSLPDGPLSELPRSGTLRVKLVDNPLTQLEVRWSSVVEVYRFEELVLDEAKQFARDGRFGEAQEYLAHLMRYHSDMPGLAQAMTTVLELEIAAAYQQGEYERAWMILTALYDRAPQRPGVSRALQNVTDRLLEADLGAGDFAKARKLLELLRTRFGTAGQRIAESWNARLRGIANEKLTAAEAHFAAGRLDEARQAVRAALDVEPNLPRAEALSRRTVAARPRVVVGVVAEAPQRLTRRLDDWASRRIAPLIDPPLVELRGFGADGGEYRSVYGEILHDATGLATSLSFPSAGSERATPHAVARRILSIGQAEAKGMRDALLRHLAGVGIEGTQTLRLEWRQAHVRPESLMRIGLATSVPLSSAGAEDPDATENAYGPFRLKGRSAAEVTFARKPSSALAVEADAVPSDAIPRDIVERLFSSEDDAVDALLRGDVDVVERIAPSHVERLAGRSDFVVGQYALPTVHVLVASPTSPLMKLDELRRAIVYAIDRQGLARQLFAGDGPAKRAVAISGPLPPGSDFADPVGYAYNRSIEPRAFDPHLSATLASVAARLYKASDEADEAREKGESGLPELVLAHPREPLARAACQMIAKQLEAVGIAVRLAECDPGEIEDGGCEFDLRYAELAVWEPVVDASRLLGPRGELGDCSARMGLALAEVDQARTWQDVRQALNEVHRVAYDELQVIPLWQTTNFFAYRGIAGVGSEPVSLYQNVAAWELAGPRGSVASQ